ncbi:uncharacterized protein JN550_001672 [Neoarthrinium moseri]|uniref:uncharacterized protein n=1 Tax=Neoarthrinium moseri TaxID=1658444 RepID=UPI001FDC5183|nr:uncharacterized protein JN550_001672 [Neoarthrinium moseri]KAI1876176.1 hypothetical protein JN550_001672 [Neoarthrinium moseri]
MAISALRPPLTDGDAIAMDVTAPPELAESSFFTEVLQISPGDASAILDSLMARAASLGIAASRPSTALSTAGQPNTSSTADPSVTLETSHARTASTGSKASVSTTLTSAFSDDGIPEPAANTVTRKRSRNLTFSYYDKYLAQVNPHLHQSKFISFPPTERHNSTPSLFSVSSRKSYLAGLRHGLFKISRRRKSSPFPEAIIMYAPTRVPLHTVEIWLTWLHGSTIFNAMGGPHILLEPFLRNMPQMPNEELEAVLKIGEASGWRRCYKCRTLVELTQGCSHMTCRCKAQFCYVCGGVWDGTVGCANYCNGEEVLERRRIEEAERLAAREAEEALKKEVAEKEAAERLEAEKRTQESPEFQALQESQIQEMERYHTFERKTKWLMWTRHSEEKLALVEKHSGAIERMKDRHLKTSATLEDRQVQAELELRSTLEQSERNVRIRLKHMEAYCDGLGQNTLEDMPKRTVTERDLRELGQQYNVEKNMKQLHQAKINVMRDRQAKALEELLQRQESELESLLEKNAAEIEDLELSFADEDDVLATTFQRRKRILEKRWELSLRILQKDLEAEKGVRYSTLGLPEWPQQKESVDDNLSAVEE